jgi:DNA (cytosine-5)-methyltransferase 1
MVGIRVPRPSAGKLTCTFQLRPWHQTHPITPQLRQIATAPTCAISSHSHLSRSDTSITVSDEPRHAGVCETMAMAMAKVASGGRREHVVAARPALVDFFSGCGGTSVGFRAAGMRILAGIDNDSSSGATFEKNFSEATFVSSDICSMKPADLSTVMESAASSPVVFSACAPCQPFSKQRRETKTDDDRVPLLLEFYRFVKYFLPVCIFIENVPGMQRGVDSDFPFQVFQRRIKRLGYKTCTGVISSASYGVPQRRQRLVALASRLGKIELPPATHGPGTSNPKYSTVRDWIGDLPSITAGEEHSFIANHRASGLSDLNLQRIRATPEGGGRSDWPVGLLPRCHSNGYSGHTDVYGRMSWDLPATGLTTRCISYSNGRFGHPVQDRAISIREAASIQTFPRDFVFSGNWESMGRQIGNAVPVLLARQFGMQIMDHISEHGY